MRRVFSPGFLLTFLMLLCLGLSTASAAVQDRITAAVSNTSRAAIPNSVHGSARRAGDLGPAALDKKLEAMTLRFSMTAAQQAALDQLLVDQQNPASPRYHQWLTPATYAAQFGLSGADLAKVTAWLTSQGFTITEVANSATFVRFNGTVAQAQTAFGTSIHTLSLRGESHFSNVTDVSVPSGLAGVVMGVTGLHDFKLKSRVRSRVVSDVVDPRFTSSGTGRHYIAPGDFYTIYNETPLLTNSISGAGQTVAIMGQVDISLADIAAFRSAAGLSVNPPTITTYGLDPGGPLCTSNCFPNEGDLQESSLDVEWAGATAPGATILFVNSQNVVTISLTDAIDNNVAPIVSISYGECEPAWGTGDLNTYNQLLKMGNSFGITIVAPTGDVGATDCDATDASATQGLAVDFPASSPYATAMGGTMFNEGSGTYWNATEQTLTAGAAVPAATYSALSYIPEAVWNEDQTGAEFSSGGGGPSAFFTKPYWQVGTGVPADASRDVPDLAFAAAASHDGYLYCVSNSCSGGFSTTITGDGIAGGTSFATPTFAGVLAVIEQKIGARIGNASPTLYALANNATYYTPGLVSTLSNGRVYNDVTTGNDDSACTAGSPNCPNGGSIGFAAGTGYDRASGWGTINVNNLATAWSLVTPIPVSGPTGTNVSSTILSASSTSVAAGTTVTLTATVTGSAGPTPAGNVQFLVNNIASGSPVTLVNGIATYSLATSCSNLGQLIIAASYSGDGTYAGSKAAGITAIGFTTNANAIVTPIEVQVTSGPCTDFSLSAPTPPTVTTGTPSVVVTVAPLNGFTGTVTFSASAVESSSVAPGFSFSPGSVTISSTASQTTTLTLTGITAALHLPVAPGKVDAGTSLARQRSSPRAPWYAAGSGVTIASLLFLILPRRRRLGALLLVVLSVALIGGATGCGSAKNGTITVNPDAGNYFVTIVGTYISGSNVVTHTTTVTFTVQ